MNMANRIKERRHALGLTQEELAQKVGLQKSAIAKYENGRVENIKKSMIAKMSAALECRPSYLMGWDDEPLPEATTETEQRILDAVRSLNDYGQEEALNHLEYLLSQERYLKKQNVPGSDQAIG